VTLVVLTLDADVARHLAIAIHRHRAALRERGIPEPAGLGDLEKAAVSVSKRQAESPVDTVLDAVHSDLDDRTHLTRQDVHRLTGASLRTIDRWISTGQLPSTRHGRLRRVARADLDAFLTQTA
jgi:excisionase family DNA binding protein